MIYHPFNRNRNNLKETHMRNLNLFAKYLIITFQLCYRKHEHCSKSNPNGRKRVTGYDAKPVG